MQLATASRRPRPCSATQTIGLAMALLGCSLLAGAETSADDWPWWRGPERDGSIQESDEAIITDASQATHVWVSEADLPAGPSDGDHGVTGFDAGAASPIYSDGRLYLYYLMGDPDLVDESRWKKVAGSSRYGNDYYRRAAISLVADDIMHCFEAATGKTLWVQRWERASVTTYKGPWSSPCLADGRVFSVGNCGMVYACDAASGEELWRRQLMGGRMIRARFRTDRSILTGEKHKDGPVTAPAVIGGVLLCGNGAGGMTAFDPATGAVRWRSGGYDTRAPFLGWPSGGRELIIANGACFDPSDGTRLWNIDRMRGVAVQGDRLVGYSVKAKRIQGYRIGAEGYELVWELPERYRSWRTDECVFYRDRVYLACYTGKETSRSPEDYSVVCVDPADGRVLAEAPSPVAMRSYVGLYAGEGRIFYSGANPVAIWNADPQDFRPQGTIEPDQTFCVAPIIVDGRLYYRGFSHLHCFDLRQQPEAMPVPSDPGGLASRYARQRLAAAGKASDGELISTAADKDRSAGTAAKQLLARARGWATPRKRALAAGHEEDDIRLRDGLTAADAAGLREPLATAVQARRFSHAERLCAVLAPIEGLETEAAAAILQPLLDAARKDLPAHEAIACARALGASASPAALPGLLRLAEHRDPVAAGVAAEALAACGGADEAALAAIGELVASPASGRHAVRALVILAQDGADPALVKPLLLRGLANDDALTRAFAMIATQPFASDDSELQLAIIRAGLTGKKEDSPVGRLDQVFREVCEQLGAAITDSLRQAAADDAWLQSCHEADWTRKEIERLLKK